jgi:hypothetical protein
MCRIFIPLPLYLCRTRFISRAFPMALRAAGSPRLLKPVAASHGMLRARVGLPRPSTSRAVEPAMFSALPAQWRLCASQPAPRWPRVDALPGFVGGTQTDCRCHSSGARVLWSTPASCPLMTGGFPPFFTGDGYHPIRNPAAQSSTHGAGCPIALPRNQRQRCSEDRLSGLTPHVGDDLVVVPTPMWQTACHLRQHRKC